MNIIIGQIFYYLQIFLHFIFYYLSILFTNIKKHIIYYYQKNFNKSYSKSCTNSCLYSDSKSYSDSNCSELVDKLEHMGLVVSERNYNSAQLADTVSGTKFQLVQSFFLNKIFNLY